MDNYFVYLRKSTDTEDRQVLSLESQKRVIVEEMLIPENIKPIAWYEESKSAKAPGRPKFDEMIRRIKKGKANGIINWQLNRLARNSVDGGKLIWLVQNNLVKLKTPSKIFDVNDILLLYVEFAMANQFCNDLSKSVKRGLSDKVRLGMAPVYAPIGYLNDMSKTKGKRDILVDEERFYNVRKMWDMILTGQYTPALIYKIVSEQWQLKHKKGNLLSRTQTYRLFHNIFYTGKYDYSGEVRQGIHKPMITMTEFEEAQRILKLRGKSGIKKHETTFTGIIKCPCSASITAEVKPRMICPACHKKFNPQHNELCPKCKMKSDRMEVPLRIYIYYHCSRQINKNCKQSPITEKNLEKQISSELDNITLPQDFLDWGQKYLKGVIKNQFNQTQSIGETVKRQLTIEKQKLQNLLDIFISPENNNKDLLGADDFKQKKRELQKKIALLEEQINNLKDNFQYADDDTQKTLHFSYRSRYWFENGGREQKRIILTTLDLNPILDNRIVRIHLLKPFEYIKETKKALSVRKGRIEPNEWSNTIIQRPFANLENPLVSGGRDLNPRPSPWQGDILPLNYHR